MMRAESLHRPQFGRDLRGKHTPAMLIMGQLGKLQKDLIPALFRIASDHEIGHIDIVPSPETVDPKRLTRYTLVFVAFEFYRNNEAFFRMLPESIQNRITVLARPADFPSVAPEVRCACYCSGLKAILPREEAQLLDYHPGADAPR
ncbi:MAG: hypothetical protein ACM337_06830 [Syntrophaceae bacterium]